MSDWDHPTLSRSEFEERLAEVTQAESAQPEGWWWCSFADPYLAESQQFLGVAIVRARGILDATLEARRLGINPGGEVRAFPIPEEQLRLVDEGDRERLLSYAELEQAGLL